MGGANSLESEAGYGVVGIASSAGGITALNAVLSRLPRDFSVPVLVLQHLDPRHRSLLAQVLARRSILPVQEARDHDELRAAQVYVAPPDRHLLVNSDATLSLTRTELVHFTRPSADLLFESMAASYGPRAIAVVLTGTGSDGSMGVVAIKKRGGTVIAQSESSAEFFGMPSAAIRTGMVDFVLDLDEIPAALLTLVGGEAD
jgi:two-component system chemotaxis response regulator CheB